MRLRSRTSILVLVGVGGLMLQCVILIILMAPDGRVALIKRQGSSIEPQANAERSVENLVLTTLAGMAADPSQRALAIDFLARAEERLSGVLHDARHDIELREFLGRCCVATGLLPKAIEHFSEGLALRVQCFGPDAEPSLDGLSRLGLALALQGSWTQASHNCKAAFDGLQQLQAPSARRARGRLQTLTFLQQHATRDPGVSFANLAKPTATPADAGQILALLR